MTSWTCSPRFSIRTRDRIASWVALGRIGRIMEDRPSAGIEVVWAGHERKTTGPCIRISWMTEAEAKKRGWN
jgi:hypothetical protein